MRFRTEIHLIPGDLRISHFDKIMLIGSCFAENISSRMEDAGFRIDVNPFGIIYNPLSVSQSIKQLIDRKNYTEKDIFQAGDIYHSFFHHSRFSGIEKEKVLAGINSRIDSSSRFLQNADLLVVTFGTAYIYRLKSSGEIVSNCHKLPDHLFLHERLTVEEIVSEWEMLIDRVKQFNPRVKILFTISPVRHWKNGFHENQLSKSALLLAAYELIKENANCYYFPSYEIMLDDLRDYRFYAEDMIHPSGQAVDYIWEKFSDCFFDKKTKTKITEWERIRKDLAHKPFNSESEIYRAFRENAEKREKLFRKNQSEESSSSDANSNKT